MFSIFFQVHCNIRQMQNTLQCITCAFGGQKYGGIDEEDIGWKQYWVPKMEISTYTAVTKLKPKLKVRFPTQAVHSRKKGSYTLLRTDWFGNLDDGFFDRLRFWRTYFSIWTVDISINGQQTKFISLSLRFDAQVWGPITKIRLFTVT